MMRWVIALLATGSTLLAAPSARACTCVSSNANELRASADLVFTGLATERREVGTSVVVRFAVREVFEGNTPQQARIEVPADGTACGVAMTVDVVYLVFAALDDTGSARTTSCLGTTDDLSIAQGWDVRYSYPDARASAPPTPLVNGGGRLPTAAVALAGVLAAASLASLVVTFGRASKPPR